VCEIVCDRLRDQAVTDAATFVAAT
jgi:hypothetical protein